MYFTGIQNLRFDPTSLMSGSIVDLIDENDMTCTYFDGYQTDPKRLKFRIEVTENITTYARVVIKGVGLSCGSNLYVTPLSEAETEKWMGRWSTCSLEENGIMREMPYFEKCIHLCKCRGRCKEIQILRRPHNEHLSLCRITIETGRVALF